MYSVGNPEEITLPSIIILSKSSIRDKNFIIYYTKKNVKKKG
jgi:hypothetical protein